MKILNNKEINLIGTTITCEHCGAELEIEASDRFDKRECGAKIYETRPYRYMGKKYLLVRTMAADVYELKCASCGKMIGFVYYGHLGAMNSALINPKRFWVNQDDGDFYVVDIAQVMENLLFNEGKRSGDWVSDCHASFSDTAIIDGYRTYVYGWSENDILHKVQEKYPEFTKKHPIYIEQTNYVKRMNDPSSNRGGYINSTLCERPYPGGIHSINTRK